MQLKRKKKTFFKITLGLVIKRGKKIKVQRILAKAFQHFKLKTGLPVTIAFRKVVSHLGNIIELRKVRVRRNIKFVPYPVKKSRRKFNIMKDFFTIISSQKALRESLTQKISKQLIGLFDRTNVYLKLIREKKNLDIVRNRANAHYRW